MNASRRSKRTSGPLGSGAVDARVRRAKELVHERATPLRIPAGYEYWSRRLGKEGRAALRQLIKDYRDHHPFTSDEAELAYMAAESLELSGRALAAVRAADPGSREQRAWMASYDKAIARLKALLKASGRVVRLAPMPQPAEAPPAAQAATPAADPAMVVPLVRVDNG